MEFRAPTASVQQQSCGRAVRAPRADCPAVGPYRTAGIKSLSPVSILSFSHDVITEIFVILNSIDD